MKLYICSDTHLEFGNLELKNNDNVDVLVLAGDIMIAEDLYRHPKERIESNILHNSGLGTRQSAAKMYREFLSNCSNEFPHVIYIAGNHEFYHGKWKRTLEVLREECQVFNNVYFLDNETKVINDVTFIGGTLWTDLNKGDPITMSMIKNMMNDYRQVVNEDTGYHYLSPATTFAKHRQTVEFIKKTVETDQAKTYVVVGHHAPSPLSIGYKYKGDTIMNGGYASDLSELILDHPQIKLWIHGHTHDCFDYMIGETRIVCNPRGYYGYEQRANEFFPKLVEV